MVIFKMFAPFKPFFFQKVKLRGLKTSTLFLMLPTHRIHGIAYIYHQNLTIHAGKYTSPIDPTDPLKMEGSTAIYKQLDFSHPSP